MKLLLARAMWDEAGTPLESFLERVKRSGFDATEIFLPNLSESPRESIALHEKYGLELVGQIVTAGATPDDHLRSLEERFARAMEYRPILVNCHMGRDIFSLQENVRIIRRGIELADQYGIRFTNEIHRGRSTFSTFSTLALLDALPEMRLNADFSHWCCVHESLLEDQEAILGRAIERCDHVHARVGYAQGPQVTDPRAPEWEREVAAHLGWWQRIVTRHREKGSSFLTMTTEFGPPAYLHQLPYTRQPVADVWEINDYMMQQLRSRFADGLAP